VTILTNRSFLALNNLYRLINLKAVRSDFACYRNGRAFENER